VLALELSLILKVLKMIIIPESGVKIAISDLNRLQSVNLAQDAVGQILYQRRLSRQFR